MADATGLLITTAGAAKIAADIGGGANLILTHVAWGDASGVPYDPTVAQVALVNERYRAAIASVAVVDNAIVVDAILPANTPDGAGRPSHGFQVAECGLFADDGTLIGAARLGNEYKPSPSTGQAVVATYRLKLAVVNPSAVTVVVSPTHLISIGRLARSGWITVDGVRNDPPIAPATGAVYAVSAAPVGAWAGFPGRLAQWVDGIWSIVTPPSGHMISDNSVSIGSVNRFLRSFGGAWVPANASSTMYGVTRFATEAETAEKTAEDLGVTPAGLASLVRNMQVFPEINNALALLTLTASVGAVVLSDVAQSWTHRGTTVYTVNDFSVEDRTFATEASTTYHIQWYPPGHPNAPAETYPKGRLMLRDVADPVYNPSAVAESHPYFDTRYDNMLIARVVTDAGNTPTVTALMNKALLQAKTGTAHRAADGSGTAHETAFVINFSREPVLTFVGGFGPTSDYALTQMTYSVSPTRYGYTVSVRATRLADMQNGGSWAVTINARS